MTPLGGAVPNVGPRYPLGQGGTGLSTSEAKFNTGSPRLRARYPHPGRVTPRRMAVFASRRMWTRNGTRLASFKRELTGLIWPHLREAGESWMIRVGSCGAVRVRRAVACAAVVGDDHGRSERAGVGSRRAVWSARRRTMPRPVPPARPLGAAGNWIRWSL